MATSASGGTPNKSTLVSPGTPWSTTLLDLLGAPLTAANYQFLNAWATREHGTSYPSSLYANNPFFTTAGGGGTVGPVKAGTYPTIPNTPGVAIYPNVLTGDTITALHISTEYQSIDQALKSGNPEQFANNPTFQKELSTWSGSGYSGLDVAAAPSKAEGPGTGALLGITQTPSGVTVTPGTGSSLSGSLGKIITQIISGGAIPASSVPSSVGSGVTSAITGGNNTIAGWLGLPKIPANPIVRGAEIVGGAVLILVGVIMVGLTAGKPTSSPTAAAAGAAGTVAKVAK